jgi:hypothetical protein
VSGHLEGVEELVFGASDAGFRVVNLEYDDSTIRADSDILSFYLFDKPSGLSWDYTVRGLVIDNGTNHRADFSDTLDWNTRWWDNWSIPPNQLRIVVEASSAVTCWLNITSGFFPDPSETVVWEPMSLEVGVNEFTFSLNDVRYPWERLTFATAGDFPFGSITAPGVTILELHAETVIIPPDPEELLSTLMPVNRFTLTLEDGADSVVLPMTSFSARLVSARASYLQAVVPNAPKFIDEITPLADGEFFVTWLLVNQATGEVVQSQEIARANLGQVSSAQGPSGSSVTLIGNKQKTYSSPTAHAITASQQINGDQTRLGFRADIKPADTLNGATIDAVQINANPRGAYMTITTL